MEDALRQLLILDALDRDGHITDLGKRMAALPLEPSLARSLLAAADFDCLPEALTTAAMLSAETIFSGNRCLLVMVLTDVYMSKSGGNAGVCAWRAEAFCVVTEGQCSYCRTRPMHMAGKGACQSRVVLPWAT